MDSVKGEKKAATMWQDREMHFQFMYFSPDDRFVIADIRGAGRKVIRWDMRDGIRLVPTHAEWEPARESPDGKLLLIVQRDGAELLEAGTLAKRGTLHREGDHLPRVGKASDLPHFVFSADSKLVLATGLFAAPEQTPITDWVAGWLGFSRPHAPQLAGDPAVARLYDANTAAELLAFKNCSQACFRPDGQMLATLYDDGTVRIWHAPPRRPFEVGVFLLSIWFAEVVATSVLARRLGAGGK